MMGQRDGFEPGLLSVLLQSTDGRIWDILRGEEKNKQQQQSALPWAEELKEKDRNTIQLMSKKVTTRRSCSHVSQSHESLQG